MPIFPNVPNAPGVPALARAVSAVEDIIELLTADAPLLFSDLDAPLWGLFLDGEPVVIAESVTSFEYKKGSTVATFPVEEGGFESYDKVRRPFNVRLQFTTGGSLADRQALRDSADAAVDSLELMDAVTTLKTYIGINPIHCDYRHTSVNGVGLLIVDMFCEQIRLTASSSFANSGEGAAGAAADSSSSGSGSGGGDGGGGSGGGGSTIGSGGGAGSGAANISITPTAQWNPQSPAAASRVSDGTVQATSVSAEQFGLANALP